MSRAADDLVEFFFSGHDLSWGAPVTEEFAWAVCQYCLHGPQQVRLRYYAAHWELSHPQYDEYAATLKKRIEAYPLQKRCLRISRSDLYAFSEYARTVPYGAQEIVQWAYHLKAWLKQQPELLDIDQSDFSGLYEVELNR